MSFTEPVLGLAEVELLTLAVDSPDIDMPWPVEDSYDPSRNPRSIIDLKDPSNVDTEVVYDPITGKYTVYKKVGDRFIRYPMSFTLQEYLDYDMENSIRDYWGSKIAEDTKAASGEPVAEEDKPFLEFEVQNEAFDRIFGGNTIDIRPQGSAEVTFGVVSNRTDNPALAERQRRFTNFDFQQRIQLNALGSIGERLKMNISYNTEATFDFENQIKLDFTGTEDDIIQKIDFGNVSLPLSSSLITGSQTLFGIKFQTKWGRLTSTTVFSQQRGKKQEIDVAGGAQTTDYEIKVDEYEANKHYFLSHYFRNQYDNALASLPNVNSGVNITRIEVWVTNTNNTTEETRNIIALTDLGEDTRFTSAGFPITDLSNTEFPDNDHNDIFRILSVDPNIVNFNGATQALTERGYQPAIHYEKVESMRKLPTTSYTVNKRLGFISLNQQPLNNDEVLAVAYEYTLNGKTYQVGQFSTDGVTAPNALLLKLLKPTITNPSIPLWDLMMKNVYTMNAFQVSRENFRLDVFYNNPAKGVDINYLPISTGDIEKQTLVQLLGLDRLDANNQAYSDGVFDFVDNAAENGGTINSKNGRVFLTTVEPFGSYLEKQLQAAGVPQDTIDKIVFKQLYDSTTIAAQQNPELNRFKLKGSYQSASGSEISLNALNIPQGSVVVTAGGVKLTENVDYTVDYNLGRVTILNEGLLESQTPIKVSLESNSLFSVQQKTFMGNRFDYRVNRDLNLGATILNLSEKPITQKVNFGDEPINNTVVGFDGNYSKEAPWLTRALDRLPFISTDAPSTITASGEYAALIPGNARAIGKEGTAYIDDFEGSQSTIDLRAATTWNLASTPQGQPSMFPEADLTNDLAYGFNRAQTSWYIIDPLFYGVGQNTPDNIDADVQSDHRMRQVLEQEIFPNRQLRPGTPTNISIFDVAFYPNERGPYNFNTNLNADGSMPNPEDSWGGLQRRVTTTNFEQANVEFIQFWLMDPFNEDSENTTGGDLYFNLGNISEDVLKDSRKSFENGLPKNESDNFTTTDTTVWGVVPTKQALVNAFDNSTGSTAFQDIGFDGLNSANERAFFSDYLNTMQTRLDAGAFSVIQNDPSNDDYHYYRGSDYDSQQLTTIQRYKRYNGLEGNSPTDQDSPESYTTSQTNVPSNEDLNLDNNLSETESYFQYKVSLRPQDMEIGKNFITNVIIANPDIKNGQSKPVKWYQFKIPIRSPQSKIGSIQDYRAIRFFRMFMKGFQEPVHLRFGRLELVRGEWRKYLQDLTEDQSQPDQSGTTFDVGAVNFEENATREPVNYDLPPGITREQDQTTTTQVQINEQSLSLFACDLEDGDARGAFRNIDLDAIQYKKFKMFVHAESVDPNTAFLYADASVFIRFGTDFNDNFYEYEIPLTPTNISGSTVSDPFEIWPEANNIEVDMDDLRAVKLNRNASGQAVSLPYKELIGKARITVKGNPVLNDIRTIMIGVRNPKVDDNPWKDGDDGRPKCFHVWVNELRMSDFNNEGGWAAIGRVNANLADIGTVALAGNISTPGFGSIEKKVSERQREVKKQFDATTNIQLGKFLPDKLGLQVPLYLGYSESYINPQYDPLNPDILFDDVVDGLQLDREAQRKRLSEVQTFNKRRSFNLTNVRKERKDPSKKQHFYDIENFAFTYSYSENFSRDVNTQYRFNKIYRGGLTYQFNNSPKLKQPFRDVELFKKTDYFDLIKEFNFYTGLRSAGFRTNIDRNYTETQVRNNIAGTLPPRPTYTKTFTWNRAYDFAYDLSRSLKFDFNANANAIIGEPVGRVSKINDPDLDEYGDYETFKDSVWKSISQFGELTTYNHNYNITYKLPMRKFPLTDFADVNLSLAGSYEWQRAPFSQDSLGHTIQNSLTKSVNSNFTMQRLYSKVGYLKKVMDKKKKIEAKKRGSKRPSGRGIGSKMKDPAKDSTDTKENKVRGLNFAESVASFLMSVKSANVTYSETRGTLLPGFSEKATLMGMNNFGAPGWDFVSGFQKHRLMSEEDGNTGFSYAEKAREKGWLVREDQIYTPHTNSLDKTLNLRATIEPVKDLRIDLTANRNESTSSTEFYRFNSEDPLDPNGDWESQSFVEQGNFSTSLITLKTAFVKDQDVSFNSTTFQNLLDSRRDLSHTIGREEDANGQLNLVDSTGYADGYSELSQDVIMAAFLSAYTGQSPDASKRNPFALRMKPNWRISYDGLSNLPAIKKRFRNFTVNHSYRSTANTSYITNLQAQDSTGSRLRTGIYNDYIPTQTISTINISEQFSPLINIDATMKNGFIIKVEVRKDRQIALSLANMQITEQRSNEWKFGTGYRFKNVKFPFKISSKEVKSDLNVRADISFRRDVTVIRKIAENFSDPTSGRKVTVINMTADYNVSSQVALQAYFSRQVNKPVLSLPFPNYNTSGGIKLRFTIAP